STPAIRTAKPRDPSKQMSHKAPWAMPWYHTSNIYSLATATLATSNHNPSQMYMLTCVTARPRIRELHQGRNRRGRRCLCAEPLADSPVAAQKAVDAPQVFLCWCYASLGPLPKSELIICTPELCRHIICTPRPRPHNHRD